LTRALQEQPTEPAHYRQIFERGIDPDVEDPEQCHSHSEIPDEWPALSEILDYQERVRNRARSILQEGYTDQDRSLGEAFWIGFEHEAMHLETFLYMLLQSDKTLPPTGIDRPNFEKMSHQAKVNARPNKWFSIPQQTFTIGLNDEDEESMPERSFGWDNEKPQREVTVSAFESQARPITNGEYAEYLQAKGIQTYPASWIVNTGQANTVSNGIGSSATQAGSSASPAAFPWDMVSIRTVFGPVPMKLAQDWPLSASYDEVASYAKWMHCRIPTFEEARSIYHYSDHLKKHPATNGHRHVNMPNQMRPSIDLIYSNGTNGFIANGCKPHIAEQPTFRDLTGCNVGFANWHPTPVTPNGDRLAGQGDMGGVWEWTSTPLMPHEGFKSMDIYPGYTCKFHSDTGKGTRLIISPADFFDGKHNIILGGSWATLPRIAGRTTL
jgi:formylglycine-generating enzyme required for sulfatase activity